MLTVKQVAQELGLSTATIRRYIHSGKIKAVMLTVRTFKIPREEVERIKSGK